LKLDNLLADFSVESKNEPKLSVSLLKDNQVAD